MSELSDCVMMRLAEAAKQAADATVLSTLMASHKKGTMEWVEAADKAQLEAMAAALSSHGLRALIEKADTVCAFYYADDDAFVDAINDLREALTLLAEPPTVKGEN